MAEGPFDVWFNLNCRKECVICLMECILCNIQYVGKAYSTFNIRLNNQRKDSKEANSIQEHNFNKTCKINHLKPTDKSGRFQKSTASGKRVSGFRK